MRKIKWGILESLLHGALSEKGIPRAGDFQLLLSSGLGAWNRSPSRFPDAAPLRLQSTLQPWPARQEWKLWNLEVNDDGLGEQWEDWPVR